MVLETVRKRKDYLGQEMRGWPEHFKKSCLDVYKSFNQVHVIEMKILPSRANKKCIHFILFKKVNTFMLINVFSVCCSEKGKDTFFVSNPQCLSSAIDST